MKDIIINIYVIVVSLLMVIIVIGICKSIKDLKNTVKENTDINKHLIQKTTEVRM